MILATYIWACEDLLENSVWGTLKLASLWIFRVLEKTGRISLR
jgi:hypothetical protein